MGITAVQGENAALIVGSSAVVPGLGVAVYLGVSSIVASATGDQAYETASGFIAGLAIVFSIAGLLAGTIAYSFQLVAAVATGNRVIRSLATAVGAAAGGLLASEMFGAPQFVVPAIVVPAVLLGLVGLLTAATEDRRSRVSPVRPGVYPVPGK
ncbi:MAG: hypothetical protein M3O28_14265 [Actinomycetota bacterium]|nr:hypothetical protein [Actinomycetota bacterium]